MSGAWYQAKTIRVHVQHGHQIDATNNKNGIQERTIEQQTRTGPKAQKQRKGNLGKPKRSTTRQLSTSNRTHTPKTTAPNGTHTLNSDTPMPLVMS
eukprot:2804327-Amphidinium_carterae.1